MTRLNTENLAKTLVVSDDDTTITVSDSSVFPPPPFRVVLTDKTRDLTLSDIEIVEVGAITGDTLESLDRAQEGTTQEIWADGDICELRVTSGLYQELYTEVDDKTDQTDFDNHSARHENTGADELNVSGLSGKLADEQEPESHDLAGGKHNTDTLANLNQKISDANVDDDGNSRPPDDHDNAAHSETYATTTGTYADLRAQSTTNADVGLGNVNNVQQAESTHGVNAPYEIQKDGTDGNGIINFKTS